MSVALRIVTVSLLVLTLGLHWALLQTVAWTGMLMTYTQHTSLPAAFKMTFDGQHPCPLCKIVKQGRADEKGREQQPVNPGFKLDLGLVWQATVFDFARDQARVPALELAGCSRAIPPPRPRPRADLPGNPARG